MTETCRSFLVLSIDPGLTCSILGISTYTKDNVRKILPFEKPLKTILALANDVAASFGCKVLRLYDAANVFVEGSYLFLSRIFLLKCGKRLYETYGFVPEIDLVFPSIDGLQGCSLRFRVLSRTCKTWPDVLRKLQLRRTYVIDMEDMFEELGLPLERLQCWYTKATDGTGTISFSTKRLPEFLKRYSDRWMDVY
jgi:hypothetical protein